MQTEKQRFYIAIDLKSFFASVECVERGLDPLTTNLVVADPDRTEKTICLAVTPSLKAHGIGGRARLFEVNQTMREVNRERRKHAPRCRFTGKSWNSIELEQQPQLEADFIIAPPRMAYYIKYSTRVYEVYLKYIAPEDIHVYSIDEVFMDVTDYLATYKQTPRQLAKTIIQQILKETGITATAGIGTNLYLCKIAMDIVAKHIPADKDGVRIAQLDEMSYREQLWDYRPLTKFWRVGHGIAQRLAAYGIDTMGKIARCSLEHEELLYKLFGINAELLIDHAWGWEPCRMSDIKSYRPETHSLSSGQVLQHPYTFEKARVVVQEMAEAAALDLVSKKLVTDQIVLTVGYDKQSLSDEERGNTTEAGCGITFDRYGRRVPKHAHATANLGCHTSSTELIREAVVKLFDRTVNREYLVRRINLTTNHVLGEEHVADRRKTNLQLDLFTDYAALEAEEKREKERLAKERRMQEAMIAIKQQFGRNAILKGLNFCEGATAMERNKQIGGHKA